MRRAGLEGIVVGHSAAVGGALARGQAEDGALDSGFGIAGQSAAKGAGFVIGMRGDTEQSQHGVSSLVQSKTAQLGDAAIEDGKLQALLGREHGEGDGSVAVAVQRSGSVLLEGALVLGRGVSLVAGEAVLRIDGVQRAQDGVAMNLGEDGGGGDGDRERIAVDDRLLRAGEIDGVAASTRRKSGRGSSRSTASFMASRLAW